MYFFCNGNKEFYFPKVLILGFWGNHAIFPFLAHCENFLLIVKYKPLAKLFEFKIQFKLPWQMFHVPLNSPYIENCKLCRYIMANFFALFEFSIYGILKEEMNSRVWFTLWNALWWHVQELIVVQVPSNMFKKIKVFSDARPIILLCELSAVSLYFKKQILLLLNGLMYHK